MAASRGRFLEWGHPGHGAGVTAHHKHIRASEQDEVAEANAASAFGALNRPVRPVVVARLPRKIKVVPKDRMTEDA